MAILNNSNAISSGGYDINNSLRFRSSASAYLSRTPAGAGNRQKWTLSTWVKRGALGSLQVFFSADASANTEAADFDAYFAADDTLQIGYGGANWKVTSQVFRDPSAWYHIVIAFDTTLATGTDRIKLYVNGSQVTAFATNTAPTLNLNGAVNNTVGHSIGRRNNATFYSDNYQTEINFIDGQALTPSSFGETDTTTGVWKPKAYTSTYGTNGFYLKFSDIATTSGSNAGLGKDFSGNTNYWTTNNISVTAGVTYDAMTDSPTLTSATVANYATLNRIYTNTQGVATLSNANLKFTFSNASTETMVGTFGASTGKWYWEFIASANPVLVGIRQVNTTDRFSNSILWGGSSISATGDKWVNGTSSAYAGASWTTGDVIGVAVDMDGATVTFYKNNASQGSIALSLATITDFVPAFNNGASTAFAGDINFGQRPFTYTPPSGFKELNTYNLPDSTIKKGNSFMDATTYTGTGASQSISGLNFQPDLVWVKGRSGATDNALYDAVRGVQLQLESNTTTDQTTETTGLTAFNSNGFTVGALAQLNTSSATYVGWSWKETATSGFDIVTYTGNGSNRTISHSLGVAPKMIIVKARTTASTDQGWAVYHSANTAAPETDYLLLNSTAATADLDTVWNDTAPTSSVFSVGTNALVNTNNDTYVAYCWAEITGFSKFGSYTGNGSADGSFIYLGFRPKFVMVKNTAIASNWLMFDTSRDTYNVTENTLIANSSGADATYAEVKLDILSNGFKIRQTSSNLNGNGNALIYMAFAENPFKNANAR